ncbi:MAG: glycerol-3-phosphate dehydrogenase [Alphaproteobacteria bacterium]|nr:glycerol-3-phosphate dehydrogenase [Alphaproteobacteria bacterium]
MTPCDLLIIGGGINGAGIARDAAGRGLSVVLCEQGDVGGATSSASSKLIHGGLRYLEFGAVRLVAEALAERERLLTAAPHLISPLQFLLPWRAGLRPAWMLRAGLLAYDLLAGRSRLPRSRSVHLPGTAFAAGLAANLQKGFLFWDGWADDARLVIANLRAAAALGAQVLPRTTLVAAQRAPQHWQCLLRDQRTGRERAIAARVVVNAAGPWAETVAREVLGLELELRLRLVKGSHIVVPRVHGGEHALVLQTGDGRVVFVLPFAGDFSLIGTTEVVLDSLPPDLSASDAEIAYLCATASGFLARPITPDRVRWQFAGVRPLIEDGRAEIRAVSRDYRLVRDPAEGGAPALSVFGGKLTTYRRLAERAVNMLAPGFPRMGGPWTDAAALPGGQIPDGDVALFLEGVSRDRSGIPRDHLAALVRRHGSLLDAVLGEARSSEELGRHFGAGLYERELVWFREREWARTADDVLWRRGKFGLHLDATARSAVEAWMRERVTA